MAAQQDTIREFLVSLGYREDETSRKKFVEGINSMTSAVLRLGAIVEGLTLGVSVAVTRWASSLSDLHFSSQRIGSSAEQITAYSRAIQNFGGTAEGAQASLENLAAFIRNTPGGGNFVEGLLRTVGLSARDANGQLLNTEQLQLRLSKMYEIMRAQGNTPVAHLYAQKLGTDERTFLAGSTPGFQDEVTRVTPGTKGLNAATDAAARFMKRYRDLKQQLQQKLLPFEEAAMTALTKLFNQLSHFIRDHGSQAIRDLSEAFSVLIAQMGKLLDWLDTHGDEIQNRIVAIFKKFDDSYKLVKPALDFVYAMFVKLDSITGGWSTNLLAVLATLRLLGATSLITGIAALGVGLAKALGGLAAGAIGAESWAAAGAAFGAAAALGIATALGVALGWVIDKLLPKKWVDAAGEKGADLIETIMNAVHSANDAAKHDPGYYLNRDARQLAQIINHNNIEVTVHGSNDPHKTGAVTADAVQDRLAKIQSSLIREFTAAVR
jgi:zinc transporter ZupT